MRIGHGSRERAAVAKRSIEQGDRAHEEDECRCLPVVVRQKSKQLVRAAIGTQDHVIPPALQEQMANRAGAHITRVRAGHLSLITNPAEVTKVILSAVAPTLGAVAATR